MSENYRYASFELTVRTTEREGPDDFPTMNAKVVEVYDVSEQHGFALVDEKDKWEYIDNMTTMFLKAMMEVTGMSDCEIGGIVRERANDFIPRGC